MMTSADTPQNLNAVPTAQEITRGAISDRIAGWWPRDVTPTYPQPVEVAFTRKAVKAVDSIRTAKEAGHLLAAGYGFACWYAQTGRRLDVANGIDLDDLAAYRTEVLADGRPGTRDATMSRLRRISDALEAAKVPLPPTGLVEADDVDPIEATLTAFTPRNIAPDRFARIETVVRAAAWESAPTTVRQARAAIRNGAYLAGWVEQHGRPLRIDTVFHPDTVEEFAEVLANGMPTGSAATVASALRTMSRSLLPDLSPVRRTVYGRTGMTKPPYSEKEVAALFAYASRLPNPKTRRYIHFLLILGLGVGAIDGEQNLAHFDDLTIGNGDNHSIVLHRPATELQSASSRSVAFLEPYGHHLVTYLVGADQDRDFWLLGGGASRRSRSSTLLEDTVGHVRPAIDMYRLRSTYLLALTRRRSTIAELLAAGGVKSLTAFDRVLALQAAAEVSPSAAPFAVIDGEATASDDNVPDALDAANPEAQQAS